MQTVAVVGAGVAGLQACRALLKRGFTVAVFEEQAGVGGVWSQNYSGYGIEVPQSLYEFPEFGWERLGASSGAANSAWTPGEAVLGYVQAYVKHFQLEQHIRFRCTVARIIQHKGGRWVVTYLDGGRNCYDTYTADYVVISTGMYSSPRVPQFQGHESFQGQQLHAKDFTDRSIMVGKRVVIVGAGKTAMDCAASAAQAGATAVTWLFRRVHWPIPPKLLRGIPMESFLFSKLPTLLCPPYYTAPSSKQGMAKLMRPLQLAVWSALERNIKDQLGLTGPLQPAEPLQINLLHSGQIVDAAWITMINRAALLGQPKRSNSNSARHGSSSARGRNTGKQKGFLSGLFGGWWRSSRRQQQHEQEQGHLSAPRSGGGRAKSSRSSGVGSHGEQQGDAAASSKGGTPGAAEGSHLGRSSVGKPAAAATGSSGAAGALGSSKCNTPDEGEVPHPGASHNNLASQLQQVSDVLKLLPKGTQIVPVQGKVAQFTSQGIRLANGVYLPADLVLYCTGYMKTYDYLTGAIKARLGLQKDGLHLYRSVLPPQVPRLGFVGSEVSTLNNVLTSGLQAEWLAEHWAGRCQLPPTEIMQADVRQQQEWWRRLMPESRNRGAVYQLYMYKYHKQLVKDMGHTPPPRGLTKALEPLTAKHYAYVFTPDANSCSSNNSGKICSSSSAINLRAPAQPLEAPTVELRPFKGPPASAVAHPQLDTAATAGMLRSGVGVGAAPAAAARAVAAGGQRKPNPFTTPKLGSSKRLNPAAGRSTASSNNSMGEGCVPGDLSTSTRAGRAGSPLESCSPVASPRGTRRSVGGAPWEAQGGSEPYTSSPSNLRRSVGGGSSSINVGADVVAALDLFAASGPGMSQTQRRSMPGAVGARRSMPGLLLPVGDVTAAAGDPPPSPGPAGLFRRSVSGVGRGTPKTTRASATAARSSPRTTSPMSPGGVGAGAADDAMHVLHRAIQEDHKQQQPRQQPQAHVQAPPAVRAELLEVHLSSPRGADGSQPSSRNSYTAAWVTLQAAGVPSSKQKAAASAPADAVEVVLAE